MSIMGWYKSDRSYSMKVNLSGFSVHYSIIDASYVTIFFHS